MTPAAATPVQAATVVSETQPRVSVIMIFLDAGRYIEEAIASVIGQSIDDWELVLVDDGSTDSSRDIARRHAEADPQRIRLYEHPGRANLGTGPSRNLGMRVARGRYLAFLDADDVYASERLARCTALLDADPRLGVVISHDLYWRRWPGSGTDGYVLPDEIIGPAVAFGRPIEPPALIAATLATRGAPMPAVCGITFRRQTIATLGGVPDGFDSQYEDQALIVKLLLSCRAVVIADCLARYRQHPASLTHRARRSGDYGRDVPHASRRTFFVWLREYTRGIGTDEPVLQRAIDAELAAPLPEHEPAALPSPPAGVARRRRQALLQTASAFLPRRVLDALILQCWAWRNRRVARRMAAAVATFEREQPPASVRRGRETGR